MRRLRDSQTVDRLVQGRTWIGLLGILLIGLVGLNVSLLKLNAAAGRNAEWAKKLRVDHADLQARVSRLRSASHIQAEALSMGLVMPAAADVHYLNSNPTRDARQAANRKRLTPPWSDSDIVSAVQEQAPLASAGVVSEQSTAATAAPPATAATPGATGTTGVAPAAAPATATAPPAGTTGTQSVSQQPSTGATVP
jgi:cytoskeletal protein RodZ